MPSWVESAETTCHLSQGSFGLGVPISEAKHEQYSSYAFTFTLSRKGVDTGKRVKLYYVGNHDHRRKAAAAARRVPQSHGGQTVHSDSDGEVGDGGQDYIVLDFV